MGLAVNGSVASLCAVEESYRDMERNRSEAAIAPSGRFPLAATTPDLPLPATTRATCATLNNCDHADDANGDVPAQPDGLGRRATLLIVDTDVLVPLRISRRENGGTKQQHSTAALIFTAAKIVSYVWLHDAARG